jgi:hypothetical protein
MKKYLTIAGIFLWGALGQISAFAQALSPAIPPNIVTSAPRPMIMLNMSKDHQLFYRAYDEFSDLDGDGIPETTYKHSFDYYGYFDSYKCYSYSGVSNRFIPVSKNTTKYCSGNWSGNFLNWSTMTRIDVVRKVLYGGTTRAAILVSLPPLQQTNLLLLQMSAITTIIAQGDELDFSLQITKSIKIVETHLQGQNRLRARTKLMTFLGLVMHRQSITA